MNSVAAVVFFETCMEWRKSWMNEVLSECELLTLSYQGPHSLWPIKEWHNFSVGWISEGKSKVLGVCGSSASIDSMCRKSHHSFLASGVYGMIVACVQRLFWLRLSKLLTGLQYTIHILLVCLYVVTNTPSLFSCMK